MLPRPHLKSTTVQRRSGQQTNDRSYRGIHGGTAGSTRAAPRTTAAYGVLCCAFGTHCTQNQKSTHSGRCSPSFPTLQRRIFPQCGIFISYGDKTAYSVHFAHQKIISHCEINMQVTDLNDKYFFHNAIPKNAAPQTIGPMPALGGQNGFTFRSSCPGTQHSPAVPHCRPTN